MQGEGEGISVCGLARSGPHNQKVKHLIKKLYPIRPTFRIDQTHLARGICQQWTSLKHSETYSV
jgi:hypothetical protein